MTCWIDLFEIELFDHLTVSKNLTGVIHALAANPDLSTSLNQYYSWPVIHLLVFAGVFNISLRPQKKYNRESRRKPPHKKRTIWTRVNSKRKKGKVYVWHFAFSVHL